MREHGFETSETIKRSLEMILSNFPHISVLNVRRCRRSRPRVTSQPSESASVQGHWSTTPFPEQVFVDACPHSKPRWKPCILKLPGDTMPHCLALFLWHISSSCLTKQWKVNSLLHKRACERGRHPPEQTILKQPLLLAK